MQVALLLTLTLTMPRRHKLRHIADADNAQALEATEDEGCC